MKKIIFSTIIAFLVIVNQSNAQMELGVKTGFFFSKPSLDGFLGEILPTIAETDVLTGSTTGLTAKIPMNEQFAFAPELLYTQKGFNIPLSTGLDLLGFPINVGVTYTTRVNYIEVPLLIQYNIIAGNFELYAKAGPSISFTTNAVSNVKANLFVNIDLGDIGVNLTGDNFKSVDMSGVLAIGAAKKAGPGKIFADFRYQHGFSDIIDENTFIDIKATNRGYGLSVGYSYVF